MHLAKGNNWNVSGAENGTKRAETWVSGNRAVSGGHIKRWSGPGNDGPGTGDPGSVVIPSLLQSEF